MAAKTFLLFFIAVFATNAQEVGENRSGGQASMILKVRSQLVIETVSVTDKRGAPVKGLQAEDFIITEDNASQTISVFEYQNLDDTTTAPLTPLPARFAPLPELPRVQIAPKTAGKVRYHNHRLLALYFDMDAIRREDKARVFAAAGKFVRTQMTNSDLLAVMMYDGGSIHVLQDFTDERERILTILQALVATEFQPFNDDIRETDTGPFGQNNSEFNIFNTDRQLSALQTAARMLGILNREEGASIFLKRPEPEWN